MSETPTSSDDTHYRVLARKYRPTNFDELIGQEAMVRTLSNAIETGRLAHAFILTGVRGVGKTTTARIIAKALNCIGPDGNGGPTISPCGVCDNCKAITESRHVDVMEMDAASRTGVDDIREIIDGVRYASVSARYKIYIIDEVHMLSRNAFNALLKTLEEPPEHVKFIFATTEIRKVPVTVLSRCQRFDLRRVSIEELNGHFGRIAEKESCKIDDIALSMISRASEGSVRDGLSLLDQAFAHGAGDVSEEQVRDMLGLADRAQILDLYKTILQGDTAEALRQLRHQHDHGADPAVIFQDMLDITHWLTRLKVVPDAGEDVVTSESERKDGLDMAQNLTIPVLTRTWQMLLKGLEEVRFAPAPLSAAEMVLVRLCYAADLPSPGDLVKKLKNNPAGSSASAPTAPSAPQTTGPNGQSTGPTAFQVVQGTAQARVLEQDPVPSDQNSTSPQTFQEMVLLFEQNHESRIAYHLRENAHEVSFDQGHIELRINEKAPANLMPQMSAFLKEWTGKHWMISKSTSAGNDSIYDQEKAAHEALKTKLSQHELVKQILDHFPGSEITDIRQKQPEVFLPPEIEMGLEISSSDDDFGVSADEFGLDDD